MKLQDIANNVCDKQGVTHIPVVTQRTPLRQGLACYMTFRIKRNGKISPIHHPKCILIGNYTESRLPILELAHELAHHVLNYNNNCLAHNGKHGRLEDEIGIYISRMVKHENS